MYSIQIFLSLVSLFILVQVYQYLESLKSCVCFHQNNKYKINVDILQFYQILEIFSLFIFIFFITMYKNKTLKGGGSNIGIKFFAVISTLILLFISGYVSVYSFLLYAMSKEDCLCVNQWQKYFIYIQGVFNTIYFLRLLFVFILVCLLLSFK